MSTAGHLYCHCQPGFSGAHCENQLRCPWPCQNGGTCDQSKPYQFSCHCPPHFTGRYCENKLPSSGPPSCPYLQCGQHSQDRVCDDQCNNHECQWDGGDCSLNWQKPWENCTASIPCWDRFKNRQCDKECDNPGCLFDGFECQDLSPCKYVTLVYILSLHLQLPTKSKHVLKPHHSKVLLCFFRYDRYCADHYGDGICDRSCYTEECGWDGLDCSGDTPANKITGTLVIVVRLQPKELLGDIRGFLRSLGALLHTNLQVKRDENKKLMVYPYFGVEEFGRHGQRSRSKRELEREVIG